MIHCLSLCELPERFVNRTEVAKAWVQADSIPRPAKGRSPTRSSRSAVTWSTQRLPSFPPEFRTRSFGDWGLAVYLIRERHSIVVLPDLMWPGLDPGRDGGS